MTTDISQSTVDTWLQLALASSRQVVFDWSIPDDRLLLSGALHTALRPAQNSAAEAWTSALFFELIHPEDEASFRRQLRGALKAVDGAAPYHEVELRLRTEDGGWRWVRISGRIIERDRGGFAVRMVGTFSDIEHSKKGERRLTRIRDMYLAMSRMHRTIMSTEGLEERCREVCRILVEQGGMRLAWIGLCENENAKVIPCAASGVELRTLLDSGVSCDIGSANEAGSHVLAGHECPIPHCDGLSPATQRTALPEALLRAGCVSSAGFVLASGDKRLGALFLYADAPDVFDDELSSLLAEMACAVSFALVSREQDTQPGEARSAVADDTARYRQMVELSPDGVIVCRQGKFALLNRTACKLLGARDASRLLGRPVLEFVHPDFHSMLLAHLHANANHSAPVPFTGQRWLRLDGTVFEAEIAVSHLRGGDAPSVQLVLRDVSDRKHAEALQAGQNRILSMIAAGASLLDILTELAHFVEHHAGMGLCSILRHDEDKGRLAPPVAPSLGSVCIKAISGVAARTEANSYNTPVPVFETCEDFYRHLHDEITRVHGLRDFVSLPIHDRKRNRIGSIALYFRNAQAPTMQEMQILDIGATLAGLAIESRTCNDKMRYLAHYDALTSLPNRFLFNEYLELALRNAQRQRKKFALFFLDLDGFKQVNDGFGHDAGDLVLCEIASRLRACLRDTDKIARMGGDEFYVLIEALDDSRHAADVAQKLLAAASRPVHIGAHEHRLSASIGIGIYPEDGSDGQSLLKKADAAMYRAKEKGKNAFEFYTRPKLAIVRNVRGRKS